MKFIIFIKNFEIPGWLYDKAKWVLLIFVPALIWLICQLGEIWEFDPIRVTKTISVLATFFGVLVGVSSFNYNKPIPMDITGLKYIEDEEIEGVEADE